MSITPEQRRHAQDLLDFIDASPSSWHVVDTLARRLAEQGFSEVDEREVWRLRGGARHYVVRGGSSLVAFETGMAPPSVAGFRIIGAHTDSPGLRLKPDGAHGGDGLTRLGVEIYGAPILATFTDRDLSLAGRVCVQGSRGVETRLIRHHDPLVRLPNLAIHMNRKVNDEGLRLNKQTELPLLFGAPSAGRTPADALIGLLARDAACEPRDLLSFEINVYDTQVGGFWGAEGEFLADGQLDNLTSCHAALTALVRGAPTPHARVCAFFDHEEVGSESYKGALGSFLGDVLERIATGLGDDSGGYRRALAGSLMISADAAHAWHPNFPGAYEPLHTVRVNGGPAIKVNVNQRYATDGPGEALFKALARRAGVPCQVYVHRSDLACGSTIGPLTAARLGIPTLDCGTPLWAMHSARESAGVLDQWHFAGLLEAFLHTGTEPAGRSPRDRTW